MRVEGKGSFLRGLRLVGVRGVQRAEGLLQLAHSGGVVDPVRSVLKVVVPHLHPLVCGELGVLGNHTRIQRNHLVCVSLRALEVDERHPQALVFWELLQGPLVHLTHTLWGFEDTLEEEAILHGEEWA